MRWHSLRESDKRFWGNDDDDDDDDDDATRPAWSNRGATAIPLKLLLSRWIPWLFERRGRSEEGTTPDETGGRLLLFGSMKRATGLIKGLMKLYHRVRGTKED
jgi:hypothetical protein